MDNSNKIYCVVVNIIQFYICKIQKKVNFFISSKTHEFKKK